MLGCPNPKNLVKRLGDVLLFVRAGGDISSVVYIISELLFLPKRE